LTDGRTCIALLQGAEQWTISLLFEEDLGTLTPRSKPRGSASASGLTAAMTKTSAMR
jgi:hypothetical protein